METTTLTRRTPNVVDKTYGHIDLSTGEKAPHCYVPYALRTNLEDKGEGEEWTFILYMPVAIRDRLNSGDWDFVLRKLDTRLSPEAYSPIEAVIVSAKMAGCTHEAVQRTVGRVVSENLYRIFVQKQIKAGNSAWLAPPSMTKVGNPNG